MLQIPTAERFSAAPASWYLFGSLRELRRGPVSKDLLGRRLVAFRATNGEVAVLDARCSHLGADLGCGHVVGDFIRCPFHHWTYDVNGRCTEIPTEATIPAFARQKAYPVVVRHGLVFVFNGHEPLFPLPFFFNRDPAEFVSGRPFRFIGDCAWYMIASNGFDGQHFQAVHDRRLIGPAEVDCPEPFARRTTFRAEITGASWRDRILRCCMGPKVEVTITCFGGPFILVTAKLGRAESYIMIAMCPTGPHKTLVEVIVFARRMQVPLLPLVLQPLSLEIRRWFTREFMQGDIDRLGGIRYNPGGLVESDQDLCEFFAWLADLPQNASSEKQTGLRHNSRKMPNEPWCTVSLEPDRSKL